MCSQATVARSHGLWLRNRRDSWGSAALHPRLYAAACSAGSRTLEEKLASQKQIKALEAQRSQKRRSLFDAQDEVETRRDALIQGVEAKLNQRTKSERLFSLRWMLN